MRNLYFFLITVISVLLFQLGGYSSTVQGSVVLKHALFEVSYSPQGVNFNPAAGEIDWKWQLKTVSGINSVETGLIEPVVSGNDIRYHRGIITEQYLLRTFSVEQQFIIHSGESITGNLVIEGTVQSDGNLRRVKGGWNWTKNEANVFVGDVFVFDANGAPLSASMEVTPTATRIVVSYDALRSASYPVTIDPQIGTDDFVLDNDLVALRAYQPKLLFNSTANTFFASWTKYVGSSVRKEVVYGGAFTRSLVRANPKTVDQTCNYDTIRISKGLTATHPEVAYCDSNYLTVWEYQYYLNGNKRKIQARLTTASSYLSDTLSLFNDATFKTTYTSPRYPAVAGNNVKYLVLASTYNLTASQYAVLGKYIQPDGTEESTPYLPIFTSSSSFTDVDIDARPSGNFAIAASTLNAVYYGTVDDSGTISGKGSKTGLGKIGSVAIAAKDNSSYLVVWSELTGSGSTAKYVIKGSISGGNAFQIDPTDQTGSGKPAVAYNPDTQSWLVAWHCSPSTGATSGTMVWAREVLSSGALNYAFPVSKQTRTSVSPTVAYDSQNHEFWIAWSGGGNKDQLLAQRWINSMSDCTISMRQDTIRENNYLGTALTPTQDKLVTTFYALNNEGDSIYPVDYLLTDTDTFQTAYLTTLPISLTKPTGKLSDYYVTRNKLFYIWNDSINYEKKNRYNFSVYAQSETPGMAGRSSSQSKQIKVVDVNEMFSATFPSTVTYLEDQVSAKIPFVYQSGDNLQERNSIALSVTSMPATLDAAALKANPSTPGGGHSDPIPRAPVLAKDTLLLHLKPDANGPADLKFMLTDQKGGEWSSLQVDRTSNYTIPLVIIPVNDAPIFTAGSAITINEDNGAYSLAGWATDISAGPPDELTQNLAFSVTNDHNSLFTVQPAIDALTGTISFIPAADSSGVANVRVRLGDDGGTANGGIDSSAVEMFTITINPVNDRPGFVVGEDQFNHEGDGARSVEIWATSITKGPVDENSQLISFQVTNDNNSLFSVQPAVDASGKLIYTIADDAFGTANARVVLKDDGGVTNGGVDSSAVATFVITVTEVNDAPSFVAGPDQIVNEDAGAQTVAGWAASISKGPDNESDQTLAFHLSNDNNELFAVQPTVDEITGDLTYTPAANANGSATVSIQLKDNGGVSNGGVDSTVVETFTIIITNVNDAPAFTIGADETVLEDAGAQSVTGWATNIGPGPADEDGQTLTFTVTNDNAALFSIQPDIDETTGTLTYTPAGDANGVANVRVRLKDNGGIANSGVDTLVHTFTITITDINDAPFFAAGADEAVLEDAGPQIITAWATNIGSGPADEDGQTLTFTVTNDNAALFNLQPNIDQSTGTLTYTTAGDANGVANIRVRIKDDGGITNGGVDSLIVTFTITVTSVNDAPAFSKGNDETVMEDAGAQSITGWAANIGVGPANENFQILAFTLTNDNSSLFNVQPDIDKTTGTLTYTPASDANGVANVRVRLKDDGGIANGGVDSLVHTFTITVTGVNDAPTFTTGADETVLEDAGAQTVNGWATNISPGPANEDGQTLAFSVTNDNTALFSVQPSIDETSGNLTYTPAGDANGVANVRVRLKDDGGIANGGMDSLIATFTITIIDVNDAPFFTAGANETVLKDAGVQTITNWATNIGPGPADEDGQTLTFTVTNDNAALFSVQPNIDESTGTLTYTPAGDANGVANVRVRLKDNGGITNGGVDSLIHTFTITIVDVNDAPTFTAGADETVLEDAGEQSVTGWATNISPGPANEFGQTLAFTVTNDNTTLFSVQPNINETTGTLTYTPAGDANGVANIRVRLKDGGGIANGGVDSLIHTFTITIIDVNDAPFFAAGADEAVLEDAGEQSVTGWATNISPGPADEDGQTLAFTVTNDNTALFSVQPNIDETTGTLVYTPVDDANGVANVRVRLKDNGGIANGGVDSLIHTFTITVTDVNDAPTFTAGADETVLEDAGAQTVNGWASYISKGPANETDQILIFKLENDNNSLFSVQPYVDETTGTLTYTPAGDANGVANVDILLKDNGGVGNGGIDASEVQTFQIVVNPVNDAPVALNIPEEIDIEEFSVLNYKVTVDDFFDADGDPLTIELEILSGNWIVLDEQTSVNIGFALPTSDVAEIKVRATDPHGASVEKQIVVNIIRKERPLIYGHITCSEELPESIPVVLFDVSENHLDTLMTTNSSNGFYYFENVEVGNYLLKAMNNYPETYPYLLSTYYQSAFDWELANEVTVSVVNEYVANIEMKTNPNVSGNGEISGKVFVSESEYNPGTITTGTGNEPLQFVDIFLKTKGSDNIFLGTQTDIEGTYHLTNIPDGEYVVLASVPGFEMIGGYTLKLDDGSRNYQNKNFVAYRGNQVITGKRDLRKFNVDVYPNPTSGLLMIKTDNQFEQLQVRVLTMEGKVVGTHTFDKYSYLKIDIGHLPKAEYLIEIRKDHRLRNVKIIVLK